MKKVRDPIHDYIHVEEAALDLVDHPVFQRLRNVRQLGTARLVYPGANHTRFEHSLGVYHLSRHATEALDLDPDEGLHVRMAALLHDVGHGPFSHLTEEPIREELGRSHVEVGVDLVTDDLREPLERAGVDPERVASLMRGEGALGSLVAGQLDLDRMDYLVRDGHYTGVEAGVDLERLVEGLAVVDGELALDPGSVPAAEALLTTRFLMYGTVYLHHAARVSEAMLERAVRLELQEGDLDAEALARMDDVDLVARLRASRTPARRFMAAVDERRLLKVAAEAPYGRMGPDRADRLAGDREKRSDIEAVIADDAGLDPLDVVLDVPPTPLLPEGGIAVAGGPAGAVPLSEASQLVDHLSASYLDHWRLRVLAPADRREAAAEAAAKRLPGVAPP